MLLQIPILLTLAVLLLFIAFLTEKLLNGTLCIKAYAESQGMSVNKLLLTALEEYKEKHNGEKQ